MSEEGKREWALMKIRLEIEPITEDTLNSFIGEALVAWNRMEFIMREVLVLLCGLKESRDVLTAELSAEGIANSLRAAAKLFAAGYVKEHVVAAANKMDEYRPARNDLVHGARGYKIGENGKLGIEIKNKSAKSTLKIADGILSAHQIYMYGVGFNQLGQYGFEIYAGLLVHKNKEKPDIQLQKFALPPMDRVLHRATK